MTFIMARIMNNELMKFWRLYKSNIAAQKQPSLRDLGLDVGDDTDFGLVASPNTEASADIVQRLILAWLEKQAKRPDRKQNDMDDEQKIFELCMEFLEAADRVRPQRFHELLEQGVPVNFQHPKYRETALHITSTRDSANELTKALLAKPETDLLLRDQFGRRAWNNAVFFKISQEMADELLAKTIEQAKAEGQSEEEFHQEYQQDLAGWINTQWYEMLASRNGYGYDKFSFLK